MKQKIKKIILKLLPNKFVQFILSSNTPYYSKYINLSFSQEGEDLVLDRFFSKNNGFYIDIGAHHPFRFSNTYKFYLKGWNGINIDAMPGSMKEFNEFRPNDINIEQPISDINGKLKYYSFNEPALNTFVKENADLYLLNPNYKIIETKELQLKTLSDVLEQFYPQGKEIDFLSIDVEGLDFNVLKSNNWEKFVPKIVLIESLMTQNIEQFQKSEVYNFLTSKNYKFVSKTVNTCFFQKQ